MAAPLLHKLGERRFRL